MKKTIRRREFVKECGLGVAGLVAAGAPGVAQGYPANEAIRTGCIGTGGRCRTLMRAANKIPEVRLTAVCDVWDAALQEGRKLAQRDAFGTKDFRQLLERKDIDAVIIGTPDHWHVPITIEACQTGKDVYVEKPLTHKASEGKAVVAAQNDSGRIVQVGMQQRSMPSFSTGLKLVREGKLGKVHKVHLTWNRNSKITKERYDIDEKQVDWKRYVGNAPQRPFDPFVFRNFRWHWDFGGGILTDLMVHYIDVINWYFSLEHPTNAVTIGDHFQTKGFWETPDTIQTLLQFPERELQVYFEGTFSNARNGAMIEIMGSEATLYLDRGHCELHPERGKGEFQDFSPGASHRGADFDQKIDGGYLHVKNWVDCVRSRKRPNAPAEAGVWAASGAHLGNLAYKKGGVAHWRDLGT